MPGFIIKSTYNDTPRPTTVAVIHRLDNHPGIKCRRPCSREDCRSQHAVEAIACVRTRIAGRIGHSCHSPAISRRVVSLRDPRRISGLHSRQLSAPCRFDTVRRLEKFMPCNVHCTIHVQGHVQARPGKRHPRRLDTSGYRKNRHRQYQSTVARRPARNNASQHGHSA